eukprot:scaffold20.g7655.t1
MGRAASARVLLLPAPASTCPRRTACAVQARPWERKVLPDDAAARGMSYLGSGARLMRAVEEMAEGKPQSVVVLGGSVSFGRGASWWGSAYPVLLLDWVQKHFPAAAHSLKNAAIPASTSGVAAACTEALVPANASLVVLEARAGEGGRCGVGRRGALERLAAEYSINDIAGLGFDNEQRRAYELLLRKLLAMPSRPAVLMLHHWCHYVAERADGTRGAFEKPDTEGDYTLLAQYYDIPALSVRAAALPLMRAGVRGFRVDGFGSPAMGEQQREYFYVDPCHPTDTGHQVLADLLIYSMQQAARQSLFDHQGSRGGGGEGGGGGAPLQDGLPPPLQPGVRDTPPALCMLQWGWQSSAVGAWVELEVDTREGSGGGAASPGRAANGTAGSAAAAPAAPADTQQQQQQMTMTMSLGHLRSYQGMGIGKVQCVAGCMCQESFFDGLWVRKLSLVETHQFGVTQHPACRVRVTVAKRHDGKPGTKVALKSLAVTRIPLVMGDVQAEEGTLDTR